jgi:CBS domain-containing protein
MKARDIMTASVLTVRPEATIGELAELLTTNRISGAPVTDADQRLVGIVTEADILRNGTAEGTVQSIMTPEVTSVSEDESLADIALLLFVKKINRVPVLGDGRLVGIVSRGDIVRVIATEPTANAPGPA